MKIVYRVFVGLGVLFCLFAALAFYLSFSSAQFVSNQTQFISDFTQDFSENWEVSDVYERLDNNLILEFKKPQGAEALSHFAALGSLSNISDITMERYNEGTNGTVAVLTYKAIFQNAKSVITIQLVKLDDSVKVQGFYITPEDGFPNQLTKHEA
ncbi:hypothetical protein [Neptuniibacter sp. QD48_11]|uniref:hypothetical protein n=1 Tax=unclassified Neptuniibacter TaxID=2630693 RepID=UPI0039F50BCC